MNERLVLVVDQSTATIFEASGRPVSLTPIRQLENTEGRLRDRELGTDKPGRMFDSGRPNKSGYDPATSLKEHSVSQWLKEVAQEVHELTKTKATDMVIVAGPQVLGTMRPELEKLATVNVIDEVVRNLSGARPEEIAPYIV